MIRFKILGYDYVELPDDFDFTFTFNNSLFSFDRMQLNRSGEFPIPVTPKNEALFGFAGDPGKSGFFVRQKMAAELHYSGGKIRGTLSVGKRTGSSYSAIFVWGELERLMTIKNAGVLNNYFPPGDFLPTNSAEVTSAYNVDGRLLDYFKFYNYKNGIKDGDKLVTGMNLSPTVSLGYLLSEAADQIGVNIDTSLMGTAFNAVGVVLSGNNYINTLASVTVTGIPATTLNFSGGSDFFQLSTVEFRYYDMDAFISTWRRKKVKVLVAKRDCRVRFESDSPALAPVTGIGTTFLLNTVGQGHFQIIRSGSEFELKKDDYFTIVSWHDYFFNRPSSGAYGTSVNVTFKVYAGDEGYVDLGEPYYLKPNLPDVTMIDLLKTYAALFHCGIKYDVSTNTISFFNYNFDKSAAREIDDIIISVRSVDRSFLDYSRKNRIECKSDDYVAEGDKFTIDYTIQNDSLPAESILFTIPFSEGKRGLNSDVVINDFELTDPFKKVSKIGTLVTASKTSGQVYLKHISKLYENFGIPNLLRDIVLNSTTVVLTVKMDIQTFLSISGESTWKWRGKHYCCVEASHSGSVAELTLVRL